MRAIRSIVRVTRRVAGAMSLLQQLQHIVARAGVEPDRLAIASMRRPQGPGPENVLLAARPLTHHRKVPVGQKKAPIPRRDNVLPRALLLLGQGSTRPRVRRHNTPSAPSPVSPVDGSTCARADDADPQARFTSPLR